MWDQLGGDNHTLSMRVFVVALAVLGCAGEVLVCVISPSFV